MYVHNDITCIDSNDNDIKLMTKIRITEHNRDYTLESIIIGIGVVNRFIKLIISNIL